MSKFILLNKESLPCDSGGRILFRKCVGIDLFYKNIINNDTYKITITKYIKKHVGLTGDSFAVSYNGFNYGKYIYCNQLIHKCCINKIVNPNSNNKFERIWSNEYNHEIYIGITESNVKFIFYAMDENINKEIMNTTWSISYNKNNKIIQVGTRNYNKTGKRKTLHSAVYGDLTNSINVIDHENDPMLLGNKVLDNCIWNLKEKSKADNNKNIDRNNKFGLTGITNNGYGGWYSRFKYENIYVTTKTRRDFEEAKIDNLIAQRFLGYQHNNDLFYILNNVSVKKIKDTEEYLKKYIDKQKQKAKNKKFKYNTCATIVENSEYVEIICNNNICMISKITPIGLDYKDILKNGTIRLCGKYWVYTTRGTENNKLTNELWGIKPNEFNKYNIKIQTDHLNHNINDNRNENIEIVTGSSNVMNKSGKGYTINNYTKVPKYIVTYGEYFYNNYSWSKYMPENLYVDNIIRPSYVNEIDAQNEVARRRTIINKYRVRLKSKAELYNLINYAIKNNILNDDDNIDLDLAYLYWKKLIISDKYFDVNEDDK